jgi:hypothetical protein
MESYVRSWNAHLGEIGQEQRKKREAYADVVKFAKRRRDRRKKKWRGKHKEAATVAFWRKRLPEDVISYIAEFVPFHKPLSTSYSKYGKNSHPAQQGGGGGGRISGGAKATLVSMCMAGNGVAVRALAGLSAVLGGGANHYHDSSTMLATFYGVIMAPHDHGTGFSAEHCKILKNAENALLLNKIEGGINLHG